MDLLRQESGLAHAVKGIATTCFTSRDVVRHPLVACASSTADRAAAGTTPDLVSSAPAWVENLACCAGGLRRWAERALAAAEDGLVDFSAVELSPRLVGAPRAPLRTAISASATTPPTCRRSTTATFAGRAQANDIVMWQAGEAREQRKALLAHLALHGVLYSAGYDQ